MRLRHVALVLVLGLALGIGYFSKRALSAHNDAEAMPEKASWIEAASLTSAALRKPTARPSRILSESTAAHSASPLPAAGTPLRETYAELSARAQDGESAAAMRLFFDLQRCRTRKAEMQVLDSYDSAQAQQLAQEERKVATARDKQTKNILDKLDASDAFCADISGDQIERRGEWLREAALDGDTEAMVCYAAMPNDFGPSFLSDAWFDWMQRWRDEAPAMVEQADAAGQADVVALLRDAYSAEQIIFGERFSAYAISQLTAPDPVRAYAYSLLYERLTTKDGTSGFATTRMHPKLSPEQAGQGEAIANAAWPRFATHVGDSANVLPCLAGFKALQP